MAKVQELTKWARALQEMVLPHPEKRPTGFIAICQDKSVDENLNRYQKDIGIVAQTMLMLSDNPVRCPKGRKSPFAAANQDIFCGKTEPFFWKTDMVK